MQWWFGILIASISHSGVRLRCAAVGRLDTAFPLRASERQRFHRRDEPTFAARAA